MVELNQLEAATVNKMVERSKLMKSNISQDDIEYFNRNYGEATADAARMENISEKIKELMIVDVESAEILQNVYVNEFRNAQTEKNNINADANMTGLKKVFNSGRRSRARAKQVEVLNKRSLLAQRKEFDEMYSTSLNDVCEQYRVIANDPERAFHFGNKVSMDRMVSNLSFNRRVHSRPNDATEEISKLHFLEKDLSSMPVMKKLSLYSEKDRDYKDASADFNFHHTQEISTAWVKRDIVGYCCKMDEVDKEDSTFSKHAKNLDKIDTEKTESEGLLEAVCDEMDFLNDQCEELSRWKNEHDNLFGKKFPDGMSVLRSYVDLQRAIKKLQISKTATKAIIASPAYNSITKINRESFEKDTMVVIWSMHSYVSGLIAKAGRHYNVLQGGAADEDEFLSWDATVQMAKKTDFSKQKN